MSLSFHQLSFQLKKETLEFLSRLSTLFDTRRTSTHGSVFLTQKRLTPSNDPPQPTHPTSFSDMHPPHPLPILIRATDGNDKKAKKIKLATVVQADDLDRFYTRYAECWKAGMSGLKKRDRSGRKAKAKGKKKKEGKKEG